ncbi:hypothetical protein [Streptomyces rochei]|uniref:hypothetical protein n=1 Tax=Streptomyces rochei TaxID=1928 RepID=UPI0036B76ECF
MAAGLMVTGSAPVAAAEEIYRFSAFVPNGSGGVYAVNATRGVQVGYAYWQADGDKLIANDSYADGKRIEAHLSTGRVATTKGHASPYTATATGNLPEGKSYQMWVCVVGSSSDCSQKVWVKS